MREAINPCPLWVSEDGSKKNVCKRRRKKPAKLVSLSDEIQRQGGLETSLSGWLRFKVPSKLIGVAREYLSLLRRASPYFEQKRPPVHRTLYVFCAIPLRNAELGRKPSEIEPREK